MENQNYIPSEPLVRLKRTKKIVLSILILIILGVLGWFLYNYTQGPIATNALPKNYVVNNQKMFPDGFPMELIFEKDKSLWQRSEDTLNGSGERIRVVEVIYPNPTETFLTDLTKYIESFGWKIVESNTASDSQYTIYEISGNRFVVTTVSMESGLFVNMSLITNVSN